MNDRQLYKLIKLWVRLLSFLPKSFLMFISDSLGLIWYHADKRHRNVVLENVRQAFPNRFSENQLKRFAKNNFKHIAGIAFEVIWSISWKPQDLQRHFQIRGEIHLKNAMAKGTGVVGLLCHLGNFEFLASAIGLTGMNGYALYRRLDFRPLDRLLKELRERFGTRMVPLRKASKKIEGLLRDGQLIGTLLDQNVDWYKGVFVDFFGRPACTNNGLARLVLRTCAQVVPMFIRKEGQIYIFEFLPALDLKETGDPIKDIENYTQVFVSSIESMVRQCPEQYFWVHNRWKTQPFCLLEDKPAAD